MGQLACGAGRWQEFVGDSEGERSQPAENSFPFLGDSSSELPAAVKGALVLRGEDRSEIFVQEGKAKRRSFMAPGTLCLTCAQHSPVLWPEASIHEIRAVAEPVATKGGGFKRHPIKALTGAKARCVYLLADMKSALRGQ